MQHFNLTLHSVRAPFARFVQYQCSKYSFDFYLLVLLVV